MQPAPYSNNDSTLFAGHELIGKAIQSLAIIFVCGQIIFLANILLGLSAKGK